MYVSITKENRRVWRRDKLKIQLSLSVQFCPASRLQLHICKYSEYLPVFKHFLSPCWHTGLFENSILLQFSGSKSPRHNSISDVSLTCLDPRWLSAHTLVCWASEKPLSGRIPSWSGTIVYILLIMHLHHLDHDCQLEKQHHHFHLNPHCGHHDRNQSPGGRRLLFPHGWSSCQWRSRLQPEKFFLHRLFIFFHLLFIFFP